MKPKSLAATVTERRRLGLGRADLKKQKQGSRCSHLVVHHRLKVRTCRFQWSLDSVNTAKWVLLQKQRKPPEEQAGLGGDHRLTGLGVGRAV